MKVLKRLIAAVTAVVAFYFSISALYKIRYYRVLIHEIGLRSIHLFALFVLLMIIGFTVYICLKDKRKIVGIVLICMNIVYALGMMSLVELYKDSTVNPKNVEKAYDIKENKNTDIERCELAEDKGVKVVFKKGKTCKKTFKTRILLIRDENLVHVDSYSCGAERIDTGKKNYAIVNLALCLKHGDLIYSDKAINRLDIYFIIDDKAFPVQTRFKDNSLSEFFAGADLPELYHIKCTTLFIIFLILLCILLGLEIKGTSINEKINEYFDRYSLEQVLDKDKKYKSVFDSLNMCLVVFEEHKFQQGIEDIEKQMGWNKESNNSLKLYLDKLKDEKNHIEYDGDKQSWLIDEDILKQMGAKESSKYKVVLANDTNNDFFDKLLMDYTYCIVKIYPKASK